MKTWVIVLIKDFDSAKQRPEYYVTPYLGTYYFRFNVTRPPTSDVRVRKALSMAVGSPAN